MSHREDLLAGAVIEVMLGAGEASHGRIATAILYYPMTLQRR